MFVTDGQRAGFVARALIYGIIGVLAVKLAFGDDGGKVTNQQGALQTIAQLRGADADRARAEALVRRLIPRDADDHAQPTRSALERALLPALEAAQLPAPRCNHPVEGHEADFVWPAHRVVVETDGWDAHGHRRAVEHDRALDARRQAAGYATLRFTYRQIVDETLLVAVRIAQVLALCDRAHSALDR